MIAEEVGCVEWTLFQEIFTMFCNKSDFVAPMIYDTKAMI